MAYVSSLTWAKWRTISNCKREAIILVKTWKIIVSEEIWFGRKYASLKKYYFPKSPPWRNIEKKNFGHPCMKITGKFDLGLWLDQVALFVVQHPVGSPCWLDSPVVAIHPSPGLGENKWAWQKTRHMVVHVHGGAMLSDLAHRLVHAQAHVCFRSPLYSQSQGHRAASPCLPREWWDTRSAARTPPPSWETRSATVSQTYSRPNMGDFKENYERCWFSIWNALRKSNKHENR